MVKKIIMNKFGLDLSHWQSKIDWDKLKTDFVILKCTESTNYFDPTYTERKKEVLKRYRFGAYHFARGGNVQKEVDWFLSHLGDIPKDSILVLDWEIEHQDPVGWSNAFLTAVKEKTGIDPYWYSNDARAVKYGGQIPFKKWLARYGVNDGTQSKEPAYKDWDIWQYTSRGKVDGISGNVDLNRMKESKEEPSPQIENQLDKKYDGWYLGKVKTSSFHNFACHLFCWAYMAGKNPKEVDGIFVKEGVYSGDMIDSVKAAKALGLNWYGREYDINKPPNWAPNIKEVDFSIKGGRQQHFVIRENINGKNVILDPYGGVKRKINHYEEKVKAPNWETGHFSYRLVQRKQ